MKKIISSILSLCLIGTVAVTNVAAQEVKSNHAPHAVVMGLPGPGDDGGPIWPK